MKRYLRRTGRRSGTFKRTRSARFPSKRVLAQRPATTTPLPMTLYPPIPAQMRLSLNLTSSSRYQVNGGQTIIQGISAVSPLGINNTYPEGFAAMMRLYSRAVVDRVQVHWEITPILPFLDPRPTEIQIPAYLGPSEIATAVIPWTDFNNQANITFTEFCSYPEAKAKTLSHGYATEPKSFYHSVDVRKAMANAHEEHYMCRSTALGVITVPALNQNVGGSPMIVMMTSNAHDANYSRDYIVRRSVTYHFTFSMRHVTSVGPAA